LSDSKTQAIQEKLFFYQEVVDMAVSPKNPLFYLGLILTVALATGLFIAYNKEDKSASSSDSAANETRWGEMIWDVGKWG